MHQANQILAQAYSEPLFRVQHLRDLLALFKGCADPCTLWRDFVGYDPRDEQDPIEPVNPEHVRADLLDMVREICFDTGTHCADIFGKE